MNFDKQFKQFYEKIKLSSSKKKELLKNKSALRERIRKHFTEKGRTPVPKFYIQGSFSMDTTIDPISAEYDIDDGVYLQNIDTSKSIEEWDTPETVHSWILEAVDGHTSKQPKDKNLCVRVFYADERKHVDLPIYAEKNENYYLAVKGKGWIESDPKEVRDWFKEKLDEYGEQFKRVVCYLKAWKDFREDENSSVKLYGGFQLTVLAAYNFYKDDSDEESFYQTIKGIYNTLWKYKEEITHPKNGKNIIEHYKESKREQFEQEFSTMFEKAKEAYEEIDCKEKSKKWRKIFGDRFPKPSNDECIDQEKETPAIIKGVTDISKTSGRQA